MTVEFVPLQRALAEANLSPDKLEHSLRVGQLAAQQGMTYASVALLHDLLEESDVTLDELRATGVTAAELTAIQLLTREDESYETYVTEIANSGDRLAISVKLCDLLDHLDPARNASLTDAKVMRYLAALPPLIAALRALNAADTASSL